VVLGVLLRTVRAFQRLVVRIHHHVLAIRIEVALQGKTIPRNNLPVVAARPDAQHRRLHLEIAPSVQPFAKRAREGGARGRR